MTTCTLQTLATPSVNLVLDGVSITLVEPQDQIEVAFMGMPGLPGRDGASGAATIYRTAGEALGGHRVVAINELNQAVYASSDATRIPVGITTGAAVSGAEATIQVSGELTEPSWNWDVTKPVFLGLSGLLTQTPPTAGTLAVIGFPTASNKLLLDLSDITRI